MQGIDHFFVEYTCFGPLHFVAMAGVVDKQGASVDCPVEFLIYGRSPVGARLHHYRVGIYIYFGNIKFGPGGIDKGGQPVGIALMDIVVAIFGYKNHFLTPGAQGSFIGIMVKLVHYRHGFLISSCRQAANSDIQGMVAGGGLRPGPFVIIHKAQVIIRAISGKRVQ